MGGGRSRWMASACWAALPVGGLMSDRPIGEVRAALDCLLDAAREQAATARPFMAMSFMALE